MPRRRRAKVRRRFAPLAAAMYVAALVIASLTLSGVTIARIPVGPIGIDIRYSCSLELEIPRLSIRPEAGYVGSAYGKHMELVLIVNNESRTVGVVRVVPNASYGPLGPIEVRVPPGSCGASIALRDNVTRVRYPLLIVTAGSGVAYAPIATYLYTGVIRSHMVILNASITVRSRGAIAVEVLRVTPLENSVAAETMCSGVCTLNVNGPADELKMRLYKPVPGGMLPIVNETALLKLSSLPLISYGTTAALVVIGTLLVAADRGIGKRVTRLVHRRTR